MNNDDLNAMITSRIEKKIAKGYNDASSAIARLKEEGAISVDYVHRVGSSRHGTLLPLMVFLATQSGVNVDLLKDDNSRIGQFGLTRHSLRQAAEKLGIPTAYLSSMALDTQNEWSRELAAHVLNEHSMWTEKQRVLVRTVGYNVRGILSDSYRRLNSLEILLGHVDKVYENGGMLSGGWIDETRIRIESFIPRPIVVETEKNGTVYLAFGMVFSTSDYGDGALEAKAFVTNGVCLNGIVHNSMLREIHLGSRLPDNLWLSEETYRLDTATQRSAIMDVTNRMYNPEFIRQKIAEVRNATEIVVDPERELRNLTGKLLKGEVEEVGKILMTGNPDLGVTGESTLWKLSQGISAFANREAVAERRRAELQEIAGEVFARKA